MQFENNGKKSLCYSRTRNSYY